MGETLHKVREKLVKEKRERRDKASSLIEVLKKSKIITEEEKEEIRKRIIDNFNKKEDTWVYEEVNKKFHGIRKIRREISKINNVILEKEREVFSLKKKIYTLWQMDISEMSEEDILDRKMKIEELLKEKEEKELDLKIKKDEVKRLEVTKDDVDKMLWIDQAKERPFVSSRKIEVLPVETNKISEEITMYPLKKDRNNRWLLWLKRNYKDIEYDESSIIITGDQKKSQNHSPKSYMEKIEGVLFELEQEIKTIEKVLNENNWLDENYKRELSKKLTDSYSSKKEEVERDDRYMALKQKREDFEKRIKEMQDAFVQKWKEVKDLNREIESIEKWEFKEGAVLKKIDLALKYKEATKEIEDMTKEIERIEEEYQLYKNGWEIKKSIFDKRLNIWWKIVEFVKVTEWDIMAKWWWDILWIYKWCLSDNNGNWPVCNVDWKPMFWVIYKEKKCKLIWWDEKYNGIDYKTYKLNEVWWKPCINIEKKNWKIVVIRWNDKLWDEYKSISDIREIWWKPFFTAKKSDWSYVVIRWDKKIEEEYNNIWWHIKDIWGKPCLIAQKENGKEVVVRWEEQIWEEYEAIKGIEEIWWKPFFQVEKHNWNKAVIRWRDQIRETISRVDNIYEIWWKPCFLVRMHDLGAMMIWWENLIGKWYERVLDLWKIWWKLCFKGKNRDWTYDLVLWNKILKSNCEEISGLKNIWQQLCYCAKENWKWKIEWCDDETLKMLWLYLLSLHIEWGEIVWWKPFVIIQPEDNGKQIAIWWNEQVWGEYRDILSSSIIWWKPTFLAKINENKRVIMWWSEQIWEEYEDIIGTYNIWGRPTCIVKIGQSNSAVMWWNEQIWELYEQIKNIHEVWWKPFFIAKTKKWKWIAMLWNEQIWWEYNEIKNMKVIWWKLYFEGGDYLHMITAKDDIMWWNENLQASFSERFWLSKYKYNFRDSVCWKPYIKIELADSGKQIAMLWNEQLWEDYEEIIDVKEIWWEVCFIAKNVGEKQVVMCWGKQIWVEYKNVEHLEEIWWKPFFIWDRGNWCYDVMWWEDLILSCGDKLKILNFQKVVNIWWKPFVKIRLKYSGWETAIWWNERINGEYYRIQNLQNIWWKPYFEGLKPGGGFCIVRWDEILAKGLNLYSLKGEIWWKPCLIAVNNDWRKVVMWWNEQVWEDYEKIIDVKDIWEKPCFITENKNGETVAVIWNEEIVIANIDHMISHNLL